MPIDAGARSDVGRVRPNNEDAFRIEPALGLYVLSDGMGGQAHGETASAIAVETVLAHCLEAENNRAAPFFGDTRRPGERLHKDCSKRTNRLVSAVILANRRICEAAASNPALRGMGATIVAAWLDGGKLSLAHVGDSRAYLFRGGAIQQLTADHSLVADHIRRGILTPRQAENSQLQNVLIRALGSDEKVEVDADEHRLLDGDALVLCSDGLTRMVTEPEIASTLMTIESAQSAAERLVELANEYGGEDNVTVIVVRVLPGETGILARLRRWSKDSAESTAREASSEVG